jgi:metallo-beta-lactamase family protein
VFLESTYGGHDHRPLQETIGEFESLVKRSVERKGKMLVPTFAVGRAQLILYLLGQMFRNQVVPKFPVFLDSPMAVEASQIYTRHPELYDDELQRLRRERPLLADLDSVKPCLTADDSKAINDVPGPCLVLAGAGMCHAGRILHHLKHNLWRPQTTVFIVGYQAEGSLGRMLVDGRKTVSIFGERIAVRAAIHTLGGFSAHAGQSDLLKWFEAMAGSQPRVVLTHGETKARATLAQVLRERFGTAAQLPSFGDRIAL